jgi:excisionase family DNA binding protein
MPETKLLLRPTEAARQLSISPRTLWTLTNKGVVPSVRLGHLLRYDPDGLREFIQSASCRADKNRVSSCHAKSQVI